ncbi:MAG: hypothetical protein AAGG56_08205 [Pseudomonadota bacterium]
MLLANFIASTSAVAGTDLGSSDAPQVKSDPCLFYRSQAWRQGVSHYAQEMLLSCEAITNRRQAGIELSDRLLAAEHALKEYRSRVIARAVRHYRSDEMPRSDTGHHRVSEEEKRKIAEESGVLLAMEGLSSGF